MTLRFTSPVAPGGPAASSPLEPCLIEAGARFEERDGWRVATSFRPAPDELETIRLAAGIADRSVMGKVELQGTPDAVGSLLASVVPGGPPQPGATADLDGAWVWLSSPDRAVGLCEPAGTTSLMGLLESVCDVSPHCGVVEITAGLAAIGLRGPRARDLLERLTSIDVRPSALPMGGVRAGAVAEVGATLLRPHEDEYLILVSSQEAPDAWEIVIDAGGPLGARPVGADALAQLSSRDEAMVHA
ncbi:MAG TPA: sarcosine oxidase subunit gamma family protein [Solirubrobacterales bacterium]|jgi:heterotetrameric sarcosine oxidase gamma subunit